MTHKFSIILLLFLLLYTTKTIAQVKPIILPEQIDASSSLHLRCYCKPGIKNKSRSRGLDISYHYLAGSTLHGTSEQPLQTGTLGNTSALTNLIVKLKIPIVNKEGLKVLAGYNYLEENYHFENIGDHYQDLYNNLNQSNFKSNAFSLYLIKSLNEKHYFALQSRLLYNGNYNGWMSFEKRYRHYNLIGAFGFKPNDNFEWGLGLLYAYNLKKKNRLLPFIFFNKNFSEKWGLEAVPPASVFVRYNHTPQNIFLLGMEYASQAFALDFRTGSPFENEYIVDHSEMRLTASWEKQLMPWVWVNVKLGYQFNFYTEVADISGLDENVMLDPTNAPFIRVGVFLSPPDKFVK